MAVEVKKSEKESASSLLRRFNKRLKQSKVLTVVRSAQFKKRPKSEIKKKEEALRRISLRAQKERLKKLGKI